MRSNVLSITVEHVQELYQRSIVTSCRKVSVRSSESRRVVQDGKGAGKVIVATASDVDVRVLGGGRARNMEQNARSKVQTEST